MKETPEMALGLPRLSTLHRAGAGMVAVLLGALMVYAIAGALGVMLAFLAIPIRLLLTPQLIVIWHPRFKGARPLSRLQGAEAHDAIERLAAAAGLQTAPALLISDRPGLSALTLTTPAGAAVILGRDTLRHFSAAELTGVLAHEIGHLRNRDSYVVWAAAAAAALALIFVNVTALLGSEALEGLASFAVPGEWPVTFALICLAGLTLLLEAAVRQGVETDADMTAVTLTGNPGALAGALIKERGPASKPARFSFDRLVGSHPPIERRIARLQALADQDRS